MAKVLSKDHRTTNGWRIAGGIAAVRNGAYLGKVGTQLQEAMHAVSNIKRQAEKALNRDGKQ